MKEYIKINKNSDNNDYCNNELDYSALKENDLYSWKHSLLEAGIHNHMHIGICLKNDMHIMPVILALDEMECQMDFYNIYSLEYLLIKNYYNCNVMISDVQIGFEVNVTEKVFSFMDTEFFIYIFTDNTYINKSLKKSYVYFTSGTTSIPKAIFKSEETMVKEAQAVSEQTKITSDDKILCITSCSHVYGQVMGCIIPALTGCKVKYLSCFTPYNRVLRELKTKEYTVLLTIPPFYNEMCDNLISNNYGLNWMFCGGCFPSLKVLNSGLHINYIYGTTETGILTLQKYDDDYAISSVGKVIRGVNIILANKLDIESEYDVYQFHVKSKYNAYKCVTENCSMNYNEVIPLNDYGYIDSHNNVFLMGRTDNIINVHGEKVSCAEIEDVIQSIEFVKEVKVIKSGETGDEYPIAYIVLRTHMDENDAIKQIRNICKNSIPLFKIPKKIIILKELKKTAMGKILLNQ